MNPFELARWNPFDDPFFRTGLLRNWRTNGEVETLALDVYEEEGVLHVRAPMPGMELKDIKITVENDVLTLSGEKREEKEVKEKNYYLKESTTGSYRRSIRLPPDTLADQATAHFDKGILEVTLPKNRTPKSRSIEVKVEESH